MGMLIYSIVFVKSDSEKLNDLLSAMRGFGGSELSSITIDGISAIVSEIEKNELPANQSNAILFAGIIENIGQQFTLLPMRFGSVMDSIETINKMLEINYSDLQKNLQKVENKSEFGLKIFCDTDKLKDGLRTKSETENGVFQKAETKNSVFREYVNQKLKEHRLEEILLSYVDSIIAEFTGFLNKVNAEKKIKKKTTSANIIDAVFLMEKDTKDELVRAVENLQGKYPGLKFILTGPWPPYNFVDITLK